MNTWQVDPASDSLTNGTQYTKLDPRPMQVLVLLAQRAGEVLSAQQIETAVWAEVLVTTNSVYQCITQLRKALGDDPKDPQYIQTIPRKGYRLIAKVEWQPPPVMTPAAATSSELPEADTAPLPAAAQTTPPCATRAPRRWHRLGLGLAVLLLAGIGVVAKHISAERALAKRERERAAQISQLMLEAFAATDPFINQGHPVTARELLQQAAQRLNTDLERQPLLRAQLLEAIGRAYRRQCLHELAVPALEEALQLQRRAGNAQLAIGSLSAELAAALHGLGRFTDSERAFEAAQQIRKTQAARRSEEYARLAADLGVLELIRDHPSEAVQLLDAALQLLRQSAEVDQQQLAAIHAALGKAYLWLEDPRRAEQSLRAAQQIHHSTLPATHPDRVMSSYELGELLRLEGRTAAAEPLLLAALSAQRQRYGAKSAQLAHMLDSLTLLKLAQGMPQEAAQLAREAASLTPTLGTASPPVDGTERGMRLAQEPAQFADFAAYRARLAVDS